MDRRMDRATHQQSKQRSNSVQFHLTLFYLCTYTIKLSLTEISVHTGNICSGIQDTWTSLRSLHAEKRNRGKENKDSGYPRVAYNYQRYKISGKLLFYFWRYDVIKLSLLARERFISSDIHPRKSGLLTRNQLFMAKICFPDPKLYPLQISAILNQKKNFHFSNFHDHLFEK